MGSLLQRFYGYDKVKYKDDKIIKSSLRRKCTFAYDDQLPLTVVKRDKPF